MLTLFLTLFQSGVATQIPDALISIMLFSEEKRRPSSMFRSNYFSENYLKHAAKIYRLGFSPWVVAEPLRIGESWSVTERYFFKTPAGTDIMNWLQTKALPRVGQCQSSPSKGSSTALLRHIIVKPRQPSDTEIEVIERAAALVALALVHQEERLARLGTDQRYSSLFTHHPDAVFEMDLSWPF